MLRVDIHTAPPAVTLICSGRIVLGVEAETLRCMTTARAERHVVLELSRVQAIDAAGLGLLVELHGWARERSARITIANPSLRAHRLILLTNLDRVLNVSGVPDLERYLGDGDDWSVMTA